MMFDHWRWLDDSIYGRPSLVLCRKRIVEPDPGKSKYSVVLCAWAEVDETTSHRYGHLEIASGSGILPSGYLL